MNVALIIGNSTVKEDSFYVQSGAAFGFYNDKPYSAPGSVENTIFRNIWNIPFVFDGYFIKASEGLPNLDLDVIFAVSEPGYCYYFKRPLNKRIKYAIKAGFPSSSAFVKRLRKKYPNAVIIAYVKEINPYLYINKDLINFYQSCDLKALPYGEDACEFFEKKTGGKIFSFPFPYNIDAMRNRFFDEENKSGKKMLLVGASKGSRNINNKEISRGYENSLSFAKYLSKKHGLSLVDQSRHYSWAEWLETINSSVACINLDPTPMVGQVAIECAILGTAHLGSHLDAAKYLFGELATNDKDKLEKSFLEIMTGEYDLSGMFEKVKRRYSYESAKKNLREMLSFAEEGRDE